MTTFAYVAIDDKQNAVNGTAEQPDRTSVINALIKQGLRPVSIKEIKSSADVLSNRNLFVSKKVKADQLVMFTRQLSSMVGAGVPLMRSLNALAEHVSDSPALRLILNDVIRDVEGGMTLGDAFAKHPKTFNEVYVNMVRAGETAGILDDMLERLATQHEKNMAMRKRVRSAMAYPMVLLCITVLAFFGLMIFIVPQISKIVTDLGGPDAKLPTVTIIMIGISNFMVNYWYIMIIGIFVLVYGTILYIKTPGGRRNLHKLILITPIAKKIATKVAIANFSRTFSALIEAGVPVLNAINVTAHAIGNSVYEQVLIDAEALVQNGKTLSSVISSNPLFPSIVSQMLAVGEETGQTAKVLTKVADFYEEEVDSAISSLSSIIEPVMIVIMGAMVGLIAASVMMPIASLSQNIQ